MKQLQSLETFVCSVGIVWLFMITISPFAAAQTFDTTPPYISHQMVKLNKVNNPLTLVALISDHSGVREASVKVVYRGESVELMMSTPSKNQTVPVKVKAGAARMGVYLGPGNHFKKMGELAAGQIADVTLVRDNYYRIKTESGLAGYIDKNKCEPLEWGWMYQATIPAKATQGRSLSYQIFAMDNFGNEAQTEIVDVKLLTEQELLNLQKQMTSGKGLRSGTPSVKTKGPFYTRPWFWLTAAVVGGGTYYLLSGDKDASTGKKTSVEVIIAW